MEELVLAAAITYKGAVVIGAQVVSVSNRRTNFKFEIRRSITIVKGDSGTGKTTLFDMIASHTRLGRIQRRHHPMQQTMRCVGGHRLGKSTLVHQGLHRFHRRRSTVCHLEGFCDGNPKTDNYYVFFTREDLRELPYSVDEIYQIKTSGKKYHTFKRLYKAGKNHVYSIASQRRTPSQFDTLLAEDSKAGLQFYRCRFDKSEVTCKSAGKQRRRIHLD